MTDDELDEIFGPAPPKEVPIIERDPDHLFESITRKDVEAAAYKAFEGHNSKSDVKAFKADFDNRVTLLFNAIKDGSYIHLIRYRKLKKKNHKGKVRLIDSPDLNTRIMEHLWFLPIEDAEIVKEGEYLFKNSTNKIKYIDRDKYVKSN